MSHVASQSTKPGEPMFADMEALQMACGMLGLEIVQRSTYAWYNRHVGDYPVPPGLNVNDLGKNAKFVVKLNPEMTTRHSGGRTPYEIGMIEDPNNPGCFVPVYDFYMGGYGLEAVIGKPLFDDQAQKQIRMLCPKLKQHYDMCCDALAAKQTGDHIEFMTAKDAHQKYPALFPDTKDESTWVSIADPANRIHASI